MPHLPPFLIKRIPKQKYIRKMRNLLDNPRIHTVCEEAHCPNLGECFSNKTCTFMILGNICTRSCAFCGVKHGVPQPIDPEEPQKIASAVKKLALNYVTITSVTRDDLPDGGASLFAATIRLLRTQFHNNLKIEVLIPDLKGDISALQTVLDEQPFVLNHNIETVPRLYPKIRPQADYRRSLKILQQAKSSNQLIYTKSGFMVGLGEAKEEVFSVMKDLKTAGCDIVTIGQYLSPSKNHVQPEKYVPPKEFEEYRSFGKSLGFLEVFSGPFVRSSYRAAEIVK